MKINQYEFLRNGIPFEPTREEIIQFAKQELANKDNEIKKLKKALELACERITELLPFHFITKEKRINYFIQQAKENKDNG